MDSYDCTVVQYGKMVWGLIRVELLLKFDDTVSLWGVSSAGIYSTVQYFTGEKVRTSTHTTYMVRYESGVGTETGHFRLDPAKKVSLSDRNRKTAAQIIKNYGGNEHVKKSRTVYTQYQWIASVSTIYKQWMMNGCTVYCIGIHYTTVQSVN